MDPLATRADVEAVLGPLTETQAAVVDGLIMQATVKVYLAARRAGIDLDGLDELGRAAVVAAVVNAVARVLRNPEGVRQAQTSQTAGPFTQSQMVTRYDDAASGGLYIDAGDLPWIAGDELGWVGTARLKVGALGRRC